MGLTKVGKQQAEDKYLELINDHAFYRELPLPCSFNTLVGYIQKYVRSRGIVYSGTAIYMWNYYSDQYGLRELPLSLLDASPRIPAVNKYLETPEEPCVPSCNEIKRPMENNMNRLTKYNDQAVTQVTLVDGIDSSTMNEQEFLKAIRSRMSLVDGYKDIKNSTVVKAKVTKLNKEIKEISELMDLVLGN